MSAAEIRHRRARLANEITLHFVDTGPDSDASPPMILLHGWPQSWHAWRKLIPELVGHRRLIVPDLRGFGDSSKPMTGYDTLNVGRDIVLLMNCLGIGCATLVGHDFGAATAYATAAERRDRVDALVIMDMLLPGFGLEDTVRFSASGWGLWHLPFHAAPEIPELLIAGREREYLAWFFRNHACNPAAVSADDLEVYASNLRQLGALRASMAYYRDLHESAEQNRRLAEAKLTIPVLALGGELSIGQGVGACMRRVAERVEAEVVPDCGHWVAEEQPQWIAARLLSFVRANQPQVA